MDEDKNSLAYRILRAFADEKNRNSKIAAIKLTRQLIPNMSLLEAKRLVEGIIDVGTDPMTATDKSELEAWRRGTMRVCGLRADFSVRYLNGPCCNRCKEHTVLNGLTQLDALPAYQTVTCGHRII